MGNNHSQSSMGNKQSQSSNIQMELRKYFDPLVTHKILGMIYLPKIPQKTALKQQKRFLLQTSLNDLQMLHNFQPIQSLITPALILFAFKRCSQEMASFLYDVYPRNFCNSLALFRTHPTHNLALHRLLIEEWDFVVWLIEAKQMTSWEGLFFHYTCRFNKLFYTLTRFSGVPINLLRKVQVDVIRDAIIISKDGIFKQRLKQSYLYLKYNLRAQLDF